MKKYGLRVKTRFLSAESDSVAHFAVSSSSVNLERSVIFAAEVILYSASGGSMTSDVAEIVILFINVGVPEKTMHGGVDASVKLNASEVFADM